MANATFSIVPETLDLTVCKGDEFGLSLTFSDGGSVQDLTGYTFTAAIFEITRTVNSSYPGGFDSQGADVEAFSITYTDLPNGELSMALTETQTAAISETGTYRWYLRGVAPGTITRTYISGSFTVRTP
jgi:hypothetical protein